MPNLFDKTEIGRTTDERRQSPVTIRVDNNVLQGKFHLISQQCQAAADAQIDKTFDAAVLVTSFGQKLLPMALVCVALPGNLCANASGGSNGVPETSLATLYRNRHAGRPGSSGKVTRITVAFDGVVFDGVLVGLSQVPHTLSSGVSMDVFRYTLSIQGNFK